MLDPRCIDLRTCSESFNTFAMDINIDVLGNQYVCHGVVHIRFKSILVALIYAFSLI